MREAPATTARYVILIGNLSRVKPVVYGFRAVNKGGIISISPKQITALINAAITVYGMTLIYLGFGHCADSGAGWTMIEDQ